MRTRIIKGRKEALKGDRANITFRPIPLAEHSYTLPNNEGNVYRAECQKCFGTGRQKAIFSLLRGIDNYLILFAEHLPILGSWARQIE